MESLMPNLKMLMFYALELSVLVIIAAVLVAAVYQIVRDQVRESRLRDQLATERDPGRSALPRHS